MQQMGHSSHLRNLSYNKKNCYNTDISQVASGFSRNIKKSKIQAPWISKVELPEFSVEPGTRPFNNLPVPQLRVANAWGEKMNSSTLRTTGQPGAAQGPISSTVIGIDSKPRCESQCWRRIHEMHRNFKETWKVEATVATQIYILIQNSDSNSKICRRA